MTREIKFRAWNKAKNQMIEEALIIGNIGFGEGSVVVDKDTQTDDELIWLEYTGLKDKNGKEIYEGDIIKDPKGQYGKIFYSNISASFLVNWRMLDGSWETDSCLGYGLEIGNIYQNPELLTQD